VHLLRLQNQLPTWTALSVLTADTDSAPLPKPWRAGSCWWRH